jgi:hypothetical protein
MKSSPRFVPSSRDRRSRPKGVGLRNRGVEVGAVPGRTVKMHLTADCLDPIPEPADAAAEGVSAADAVITNVDHHQTVALVEVQLDVGGLGVLGHVGERLGDEEVGRRFDMRRIALVADGNLDGQRASRGESGCCCAQPPVCEDVWV